MCLGMWCPFYSKTDMTSTSYTSAATTLRLRALSMLREAKAIDGLNPYVMVHDHRCGTNYYLHWAPTFPTDAEVEAYFGETLDTHTDQEFAYAIEPFTLEQLTGVAK